MGTGLVILFLGFALIDISRNMPLDRHIPTTTISLALYLFAVWFWRKATFRRIDFVNVGKSLGVKFIRKMFYYWIFETHRYADGFLDDIYVVARLDFPFWSFSFFPRDEPPGGRDYSKPDYMKEEAKVALFSLIKGQSDINAAIRIENGKRNIPIMGNAGIDKILSDSLRDVDYFHARLIANKDCLQMTLIGGSWEGRRFGEKILKGVEIFQKIDAELKAKYPAGDWKDWQVKWNRKEEEFYLEAKGRAA